MASNIQLSNTVLPLPSESFNANVKSNLMGRKVQLISSGISTALTGGAAATAAILGGPLAAIIALATAAFTALTVFVASLVVKQRTVTTLPQPETTKFVEQMQVEGKSSFEETTSIAIETPSIVAQEKTSLAVQEEAPKKGMIQNAISYAKENPFKTALGAAVLVGASAAGSYGAYAYLGAKIKTVPLAKPSFIKEFTEYQSRATCPKPTKLEVLGGDVKNEINAAATFLENQFTDAAKVVKSTEVGQKASKAYTTLADTTAKVYDAVGETQAVQTSRKLYAEVVDSIVTTITGLKQSPAVRDKKGSYRPVELSVNHKTVDTTLKGVGGMAGVLALRPVRFTVWATIKAVTTTTIAVSSLIFAGFRKLTF